MIPGIVPAIGKKKAAPDPGGDISFTMTAGYFEYAPGFGMTGYIADSPQFPGGVGSIDKEPIPGYQLSTLQSGVAGNFIVFVGDCLSQVSGKTVWVDGVSYPFDGDDWFVDTQQNTATWASWDSAGPVFVESQQYFIEIK